MHPRESGPGDRGGSESLILKSAKKEKGVSVKKRRGRRSRHSFDEHFSARVQSVCSRRRLLFSRGDREMRRRKAGKGGREGKRFEHNHLFPLRRP